MRGSRADGFLGRLPSAIMTGAAVAMVDARVRRQNHSCDQCRRSKKACDGYVVNLSRSNGVLSGNLDPLDSPLRPCSYCTKTSKQCTLNPHWGQDAGGHQAKRRKTDHVLTDSELHFLQTPACAAPWTPGSLDMDIGTLPFDLLHAPCFDDNEGALPARDSNEALDRTEPSRHDSFSDATTISGSLVSDLDVHSATWCMPRLPSTEMTPKAKDISQSAYTPLSFFDADYATMATTNNHLISDSLLAIYHDVLENNLTCWLSEDTCPYQMPRASSLAAPQPEWGAAWSNRIYRRVIKLDRAAQATGLARLAGAESKSASKALALVIMAFATQWSQGKRRRGGDDVADELASEFERNIQQAVWEQARRALQGVQDLESFQVVYAELIFGLIHKPTASHDQDAGPDADTVDAMVAHILSNQGPPVFMERAARKMHALKARFDADEAISTTRQYSDISQEDRGTMGLLYWLAVMFDTVSSSMNGRPVALTDEAACLHENRRGATSSKWVVDAFVHDSDKPRWPCPYDDAASAITNAAPIKVLLFRHVSYLQHALGRKQRVDEAVQGALGVYKYWNQTFGDFFDSLISDYVAVPSRLKSWFVCIAVPWHLAALMLADLLDVVDKHKHSPVGHTIRKSSAAQLARLAAVTTPPGSNDAQLPELHFAISEGSLLTEPWSMLLIRAFSKAALVHVQRAQRLQRLECEMLGVKSDELRASLGAARACVAALGVLGRKAEVARRIEGVLRGVSGLDI